MLTVMFQLTYTYKPAEHDASVRLHMQAFQVKTGLTPHAVHRAQILVSVPEFLICPSTFLSIFL